MSSITGILLAAGRSERMGQPKLLLPWRGARLVRHVAERALHSQLDDLVVVVGHLSGEVLTALDGLPVRVAHNAAFREGQSTSLRAGLAALDSQAGAAMMLLADQPLLQVATINALIEAYRQQRAVIVAPRFAGQRGNPVLFDRALFPELAAITGDQGAREVLETHARAVSLVDVADHGVLIDVDTPDAYRKWAAHDYATHG